MPKDKPDKTRRAALGGLASAGLLAVAGCSSSPSTNPTTTTTSQPTTNSTTTERTTTTQPVAETTVLDDFESLSKWNVESGRVVADTETAYSGSQSARLERKNGPVRLSRSFDLDMSTGNLSMAFKMQSSGNAIARIYLHAPDEENRLMLGEGVRQENSGNWFRLDAGARSVDGLPDMEKVRTVEIEIQGGGSDTTFWVDDLRRTPSPEKGYALLFFDDGLESAHTVGSKVLSKYDMPATVSTVTSKVGDDGYLTVDQMKDLQQQNWEMASHTHSSVNLQNISRLTAEQEIVNAKEWLVDHGFETGARWLVYPYGNFTDSVADFAREYHDLAFRYMGARSAGSGPVTHDMSVSRGDGTDLDLAKRMIDLGDLYSDIQLFTFHDVGDGDGLSMNRSEFEEFAAYLADSPLEVITPSTLYDQFRAQAPEDP